jgi:hypothetical protein
VEENSHEDVKMEYVIRPRKNLALRICSGAVVSLALVFAWIALDSKSKPVSAKIKQDPMPSRWVAIAFSHKRNNGTWAVAYDETFQTASAKAIQICESTGGIKCGVMMHCDVRPPDDPRRLRFAAFARDSFVGIGGNRNLTCGFASIKAAEAKAMQGACDPAVSRLEWGPCTIVWSASIYP